VHQGCHYPQGIGEAGTLVCFFSLLGSNNKGISAIVLGSVNYIVSTIRTTKIEK
jgi:hypothetical protein